MKAFITLFLGLTLSQFAIAQNVVFSALAVNGTSMIQRGANPDEFVTVTTGVHVFENDKIIVTGADSYIGLVSTTGKVTEITKGGVFSAQDLVAGLITGNADLADEYSSLLAENTTSTTDDVAKYSMYMGASVDRSITNTEIELFLPARSKISDNLSSIEWTSKISITNYSVSITNLYEEEVFSQTTSETNLTIDFASIDLNPGEVYRITVVDGANASNISSEITLQVPTRSELAKYQTDLEMLKNEVPPNSAIGDMVFATYFEEQGLFLEAIPFYQSAIAKEPNILEYKNAYQVFLYKIGMEK